LCCFTDSPKTEHFNSILSTFFNYFLNGKFIYLELEDNFYSSQKIFEKQNFIVFRNNNYLNQFAFKLSFQNLNNEIMNFQNLWEINKGIFWTYEERKDELKWLKLITLRAYELIFSMKNFLEHSLVYC